MESALVFLLYTYVLCFKFIIAIGSMFFLNWFHLYLPLTVPDYGNEYMTKENKN